MRGMAVQPTRCVVRDGAAFSYLLQKPAMKGKGDITSLPVDASNSSRQLKTPA